MFGVVTSFFTLGGLLGSSSANLVMNRVGRKGALVLNSIFIAVGSGIFAISSDVPGFLVGR